MIQKFLSLGIRKPFGYLFVFIVVGILTYGYVHLFALVTDKNIEIANLKSQIAQNEDYKKQLENNLQTTNTEKDGLQNKINQTEQQVESLQKLSETDKELLQKYSKVFFLNEHYVPRSLSLIDNDFLYEKKKDLKIHSGVLAFLEDMVEAGRKDGMSIKIISAYRSFAEQTSLKSTYKVTYGSGANTFSADQGYSEHQLGTALDFTSAKLGANYTSFEKSPEYEWFINNAYKYGFTLSYPKGNKYYVYEPWHWRFVGIKLATRLHEEGKYFYDLDQRTIDEYLGSIFEK